MKEIEQFFLEKYKQQNCIPTYFDNLISDLSENGWKNREDVVSWIVESKRTRFSRFEDRIERLKFISNNFDYGTVFTQGTHTTFKWKGLEMFKSCYDLAVYTMIINDVKPEVIIEYGSGNGSSAVWLSDMCEIHGLKSKVVSYDRDVVHLQDPNVTYKTLDLIDLTLDKNEFTGRKLVIEDAHSHVYDVLLKTDVLLESGDYLIVEDSSIKQDIIYDFIKSAKNQYVVDNYYVDFFGINALSSWNSILKVL